MFNFLANRSFLEKISYKSWIILIVILTIPTFYQLIRPGFFFMQDDLQAMRVHQMFRCLQDFQIPCRWVPDMGYQYGYPQFLYYPPSVYYLGALIHLFAVQIIDSVKILFIFGYILSTLFMFIFLKAFFDGESKEKRFVSTTLPAFLGAMLYTYIPYKALEVYVRGALNEFWSLVFFPLIFWAIYQLISKQKLKYVIFLALSTAALMLTHNLMTLIFAPLSILWCLSLLVLKKTWKVIPKIFLGGLLGIGLAAFFTLPVIFEGKYAHLETLVGGYFDYRQHFVSINRLLISNQFGYGSSGFGQDNNLTLSTGQIQWMVALFGFILAPFFLKKHKNIAILVIINSLVELVVLFLIHQKSSFIWERIPIMVYLQFPWRFLTDSIFLLSFLGAGTIFFISQINIKGAKIFATLILIGIFLLHAQFFKPKEWFGISDKDKFSGPFWEKELTISIFDYLPAYAELPPNKIAPDTPEVLEGKVRFITYRKGSNYQIGEVEAREDSVIRLPLFDFPGMRVTVDGKVVGHKNDDCRGEEYCLGLITFDLPQGSHLIKAQLMDTQIRSIGNIITLTSFLLLLVLVGKNYGYKKVHL
ncbi:hypothetical protein HYS96_02230 [Candidatus Daviesbacteria bacterium]|nr:hypothetical protein [Candidatus Daviesbacteria bacterium]